MLQYYHWEAEDLMFKYNISGTDCLSKYIQDNIMTEELMEHFKKDSLLYWYPDIPEALIRELINHCDNIDWKAISCQGRLSSDFIEQYLDYLDTYYLIVSQALDFN